MMYLEFLSLFFSAWFGGGLTMVQWVVGPKTLGRLLSFSAGYLLATTFVHLIPALFIHSVPPIHIGSFIMVGFLIQRFIESSSGGVEHGHGVTLSNHVGHLKPASFLASMGLHAMLDGILLMKGDGCCHMREGHSLILAMMLHKFVEALTLMGVLRSMTSSKQQHMAYLLLFSLVSPIGLGLAQWLKNGLSPYICNAILAMVTGNFLYISATMLFETSPEHRASKITIWTSLLGSVLATLVEYIA